jgi:hypothetical protein
MRRSFEFRGEGVDFLTQQGFRYCHTLGWYGWWNLDKCQRAIVDFNSKSKRRCWAVTIWKTDPKNLPAKSAHFSKVP